MTIKKLFYDLIQVELIFDEDFYDQTMDKIEKGKVVLVAPDVTRVKEGDIIYVHKITKVFEGKYIIMREEELIGLYG